MTVQDFSNLAMVTAVVIYLLAFAMHAVEWAAGRKVGPPKADRSGTPELVGAGVSGSLPTSPDLQPTSTDLQPTSPELVEGPPLDPALGQAQGTDAAKAPGAAEKRTELFGRLGVAFTVIALASNVVGVAARGIAAERWPLGNMYEFTTMAMVLVVAAYLVLAGMGMRWLGLFVTLLALIGNGLAVTVFYVAVSDLVPSLHSVWFVIHITAAAISGAAFNVGGLVSILYLIKNRIERKGGTGGYLARLPEPKRLDVIAYRLLAFAFPLWTFTIAAGAIWAEYAWGRFWGWDPKETWALVTWVIYACYLHARATAGWKGNRAAIIAIIGLVSFWFNFIGVNLLFSGLHSYAGI